MIWTCKKLIPTKRVNLRYIRELYALRLTDRSMIGQISMIHLLDSTARLTDLLCILTSERMLGHAFAWSKMIKNIRK